jgi:hypothetical protein
MDGDYIGHRSSIVFLPICVLIRAEERDPKRYIDMRKHLNAGQGVCQCERRTCKAGMFKPGLKCLPLPNQRLVPLDSCPLLPVLDKGYSAFGFIRLMYASLLFMYEPMPLSFVIINCGS